MNDASTGPQEIEPSEGRYANHFKIGHTAFEFLLDFSQFSPESQVLRWHTRIITNPACVKALYALLQESIAHYEQTFGSIPTVHDKGHEQ